MKDRKGWIKVAVFVGTSEPELVDAPKTGSSMVGGGCIPNGGKVENKNMP